METDTLKHPGSEAAVWRLVAVPAAALPAWWWVYAHLTAFADMVVAAIALDTNEPDRRLALLHNNVKKYGTVFNTVAPGAEFFGVLRRRADHAHGPG